MNKIKFVVYLFVSIFFSSSQVAAQISKIKHFDLPSQPLSTSLMEFAIQANISLFLVAQDLEGKTSPSIVGPYQVDKALTRLLSRSDLSFNHSSTTDSYQVVKDKIRPSEITPLEIKQQSPGLDEIVVTAMSYPNRYHTLQHSRTHSGLSSFESVRLHSTLTQPLMEDQNPPEVRDILKFVSGLTLGDGYGDTNDDFFVRGFPRHSMYIDNYRLESSTGVRFLSDHIEQIEVIKGPSSLFYGQGQPGGVVNLVRKKPGENDALQYVQDIGEDIIKTRLDWNIPWSDVTASRSILAFSESNPNLKLKNLEQWLGYHSQNWQWDRIQFNGSLEWQRETLEKIKDEQALNAYLNLFPGATLDEILHQKSNHYQADFYLASLEANYAIKNNWLLSGSIHWQEEKREGIRTNIDQARFSSLLIQREALGADFLLILPASEMAIPIVILNGHLSETDWRYRIAPLRTIYDEASYETGLFGALNLEGQLNWAGAEHNISLGVDAKRQDTYQEITIEERDPYPGLTWGAEEFSLQLAEIAQAALFDPTIGQLEEHQERRVYDEFGAYLQDSVQLSQGLVLSAGLRYTRAMAELENIKGGQYDYPDITSAFSGQFGLSKSFNSTTTFFANYSESLRANYFQYLFSPDDIEPEHGNQIELGFKINALSQKLLASLALYRIEKENIYSKSLQLYIEPVSGESLPLHNQISEGIEFDASYEPANNTQVIFSASLMRPRISSGAFKNNQPALTASSTANLLLRQSFSPQFAAQFVVQYVGERYGDEANSVPIGEYQLFDVKLNYFPQWAPNAELGFTVENIFDESYFTTVVAGARLNYGSPRTAYVTLKYQFY